MTATASTPPESVMIGEDYVYALAISFPHGYIRYEDKTNPTLRTVVYETS
jgi:hypothetical protein